MFVKKSLEPLSSSSSQNLPGETSPETGTMETVDEQHSMVRVTYKSGNVFEGRMSKWSPHGVGRLSFNNGATIYEVTLHIIYRVLNFSLKQILNCFTSI